MMRPESVKLLTASFLVVESERTRSEVVDHALDRLKSAGADILGIILNKREFHIPKGVYRFL